MKYYLVHIQYLGFRFHGWQCQPGVKTVEAMVKKTVEYVLGHPEFKILGTSRTDAMVSAVHTVFELFVEQVLDPDKFLADLNLNLPPDIRAKHIEGVGPNFNIINSPRTKEYHYFFCFGEKCHPFCAPFMAWFPDHLDLPLMALGARLFIGVHDFSRYCTRPGPDTNCLREIIDSRIQENQTFQASFFPDQTWVFRVRAQGFMRHQVRLMMGQLIALGRKDISLDEFKSSLTGKEKTPFQTIAPASGLMLYQVKFDHDQDEWEEGNDR